MNAARDTLAMLDDRAMCAFDGRLDYFEVQAGSGRTRGRLPVVVVKQLGSLNEHYLRYLGLTPYDGSAALVGGGLARMWSGSSLAGLTGTDRHALLAELVRRAVDRASGVANAVVSPFLTATDLPAYLDAAPDAAVKPRGVWCALEIGGATGVDDFVERQEKRFRKKWRRDLRDAAELGLEHDWVPVTDACVDEAAPGIASVAQRNGIQESAELVAWRLSSFRRRPGRHFFVRTWQDSRPVAHTLCRSWEGALDAHTIGIADDPELDRRTVYHAASLLGPLAAALATGAERLELGFGHETPKLQRGCTGEDLHFADLLPGGY